MIDEIQKFYRILRASVKDLLPGLRLKTFAMEAPVPSIIGPEELRQNCKANRVLRAMLLAWVQGPDLKFYFYREQRTP